MTEVEGPALETIAVSDVVAGLRAWAETGTRGCVATDADGTLWSGDVGEDLLHAALDRGMLRPPSLPPLEALARRRGIPLDADPNTLARRCFDGYRQGVVSELDTCEMTAWCFAGWHADELEDAAAALFESAGLSARLQQETVAVLDEAARLGFRVLVVSASPEAAVRAGLHVAGVRPDAVAAATPCTQDGVLVADVQRPIPYGTGKVHALKRLAPSEPWLAILGDNGFDAAMLAEARLPLAVRPKPALARAAGSIPALRRLIG